MIEETVIKEAAARAQVRWMAAPPLGTCAHLAIAGLITPGVRYEPDGTALIPLKNIANETGSAMPGLQSIKPCG